MKNNFEDRRNARLENAKNQAQKNRDKAGETLQRAAEMARVIPFGQPILIGHHSEKKDRNYRNKIDSTYRRGFEMIDKADYYEEKAKAIEANDAISSDDPAAVEKLTEKLNQLKAKQEFMKAANRCIRKQNKDAFLLLPGATEAIWQEITTPGRCGGMGFPHFKLTNNNAKIKQAEQRIRILQLTAARPVVDKTINGVRIFENHDVNRLQLFFDGKPDENIRKQLKSCGFRWAPSEGAWQKNIGNRALHDATRIAEFIGEYLIKKQLGGIGS